MNEPIAHSGIWILALIMIVVASWYLYKYMAPSSWHEWAGAGVVQAFIIALYAEMYGFPLTIYLLARFGGLDRTELSANLWSSLLGVGETGMMISMVLGYILLFLGIGLFFQGWRQVYKARQEKKLVTDGLYALALFPIIVFIYYRLSLREEKKVIAEFGGEYLAYKAHVPMFIPRIEQWKSFIKQAKI